MTMKPFLVIIFFFDFCWSSSIEAMEVKSLGANLVMEFSTLMCDLKMSIGKCLEGANSKGITLGKKVGRQQDQDEQHL